MMNPPANANSRSLLAAPGLAVNQDLSPRQMAAARILLNNLWGCSDDCGTCAAACCGCAPLVAGIAAGRLGLGGCAPWAALSCGSALAGAAAVGVGGAALIVAGGNSAAAAAVLSLGLAAYCLAPACIGAHIRSEALHRAGVHSPRDVENFCSRIWFCPTYNLAGIHIPSFAEYVCLHLWCAPCALTQVAKAARAMQGEAAPTMTRA